MDTLIYWLQHKKNPIFNYLQQNYIVLFKEFRLLLWREIELNLSLRAKLVFNKFLLIKILLQQLQLLLKIDYE